MNRKRTSGSISVVSQADSTDWKSQTLSALPLKPTSRAPIWVELSPSLLNHILCGLLTSDKQSLFQAASVCKTWHSAVHEVILGDTAASRPRWNAAPSYSLDTEPRPERVKVATEVSGSHASGMGPNMGGSFGQGQGTDPSVSEPGVTGGRTEYEDLSTPQNNGAATRLDGTLNPPGSHRHSLEDRGHQASVVHGHPLLSQRLVRQYSDKLQSASSFQLHSYMAELADADSDFAGGNSEVEGPLLQQNSRGTQPQIIMEGHRSWGPPVQSCQGPLLHCQAAGSADRRYEVAILHEHLHPMRASGPHPGALGATPSGDPNLRLHQGAAQRSPEDGMPVSMINNSSGAVIVASIDGHGSSSDDEVQQPAKY
ncbi:hypothetical protein CEUSTIGMA_g1655.t1 [Chlamydomonas eustigma]|uniref:Uncharacterized protein n=1 Tax=Chlamydomonas eustigma TaxID=1157962 RepID=A0A250WTX0_9CHLO|nr:hypothetical protein CEUSTIGMA_g1655.t1 [Chlamydomonas eustigma]|eukprot:GAX74206.1 hypothetical protein CEUSTIGMA_g1655.t1 [Chlamydomonas eustigma]